jgi:hypothetical protein
MRNFDKPLGNIDPAQKLVDEMKKLLESPTSRYPSPVPSQKTDEIYRMIKELKEKLEKREETLRKVSLLVIELYELGQINEITFKRFEFLLHEWTKV